MTDPLVRERLVIDRAEVDGRVVHVVIEDGRVTHLGEDPGPVRAERIDAGGAALLPGLHDHHVHLLAAAAAMSSVDLGTAASVTNAIANAPGDGWVRAVGYHESLHGPLDRAALDRIASRRPVRVQHRSGMMWVLNSAAMRTITGPLPPGVGRDEHGEPDGTFVREDEWLRAHLGGVLPDVDPLIAALLSVGITGATDMTPHTSVADLDALAAAVTSMHDAGFCVDVTTATAPELADAVAPPPLRLGPVKVLADEATLPDLDDLVEWIGAAHARGRNLAVHCVTRSVLAFVVAAFDAAGTRAGDRIEHGAVVPPELAEQLHGLGLIVVTQPGFVHARGEQYRADVDPSDLAHLWPCASLLDAGVGVAASTDAPFGPLDPWRSIATATTRLTKEGRPLGERERVDAATALSMWLTEGDHPSGPARRVRVGSPARLCLLDRPLAAALTDPGAVRVVRTVTAAS